MYLEASVGLSTITVLVCHETEHGPDLLIAYSDEPFLSNEEHAAPRSDSAPALRLVVSCGDRSRIRRRRATADPHISPLCVGTTRSPFFVPLFVPKKTQSVATGYRASRLIARFSYHAHCIHASERTFLD